MNVPIKHAGTGPARKLGRVDRPTKSKSLIRDSHDREFLPASLEILDTPASPRRAAFVWLLCLLLVSALVWSCIAQIDIYAVGTGRVEPTGRSKVIQPFDPGKVTQIAVREGMKVKAGDLLLELDPTEAEAERDATARDLASYKAEISRRRAEISAVLSDAPDAPQVIFDVDIGPELRARERNVFTAELAQYRATRDSLRAQIAEKTATNARLNASIEARQRLVGVLRQRLDMKKELVSKAAGTQKDVLDAEQQVYQELTNLAYDQGQLKETAAGIESLQKKIEESQKQFVADQAQKLSDAEFKADHLKQDLIKAAAKADRTRIVAPLDGTVQQLAVTTLGQVVTTGQPLLVIVPNDLPVEIEALIQSSDIGFVAVGQDAVVKVDAFPFTRYGTLNGKVDRVSGDAIYDKDAMSRDASTPIQSQNGSSLDTTPKTQNLVYEAGVKLEKQSLLVEGREVPLAPGMTATVEIRTGKRRVIEYLLSPLREMVSGAAHER
ncbi:MAG TPA: HlyD family type I secretion periplasmic adaptor subunit [Roseiarcus sp.]|nr:HlyD family type I secretion periplasmic adaptor subunit [Roseiarcus sp.]